MNNRKIAQETDEITEELERLVARPRTPITEMKIRKLLKRAGYPVTAKNFARRKHGGRP